MTTLNNPSVTKLMGNKIIFKIGFKIISKTPKTRAVLIILAGIAWKNKLPQIWFVVIKEKVNKRVNLRIFLIFVF